MTDPTSPATVALANERHLTRLDSEPDEPRETPCGADWHERCDGWALVPAVDELVPCPCTCHLIYGREDWSR